MLGYEFRGGCYRHPGRQAIFLGDFVDRGPGIRETLQVVRAMVDRGAALAVMGNHEYNAIAYHTPDGAGGYFRPHTPKKEGQHIATLRAFQGREDELRDYLKWFESLPLFLDLGALRIVHACWDEQAIRDLGGSNRYDASLLAAHGAARNTRQEALHTLIKGPEIGVPGGDEYGEGQKEMRVKWWLNGEPIHYCHAGLQVSFDLPDEPLTEAERKVICGYAGDASPVFFGHYGYLKPAEALAPNVTCIDLGVAHGGPLCAYRWDGERQIDAAKFVCVQASTPSPEKQA